MTMKPSTKPCHYCGRKETFKYWVREPVGPYGVTNTIHNRSLCASCAKEYDARRSDKD